MGRPTPEEIQKLASATGKQLEVTCARAFVTFGHNWRAHLGSYFDDGEGPPRELDVLADRSDTIPSPNGEIVAVRVRALLSCRGFPREPEDAYPMAYSVASNSPLVLPNRLPVKAHFWGGTDKVEERLGFEMAASFVASMGLRDQRPIVALDVIEREKDKAKAKNQEFKLRGDRRIYTAIDSAVKAAMYWARVDHMRRARGATIYVPVCVFSDAFSDVSIDDGTSALPELRTRGFQTCGYPMDDIGAPLSRSSITTLIVTVDEIDQVIGALEGLFIDFRNAVDYAGKHQGG